MSTKEQQAMGVERLTFEVEGAERNGFSSIQPIGVDEARYVLDALAAAQQEALEWKTYAHAQKRHLDKADTARKTAEDREDAAEATLRRVRAAGRSIVLASVQGGTIIHDAGIMQDDACMIAEALRGTLMNHDEETEEAIYLEVGFLTAEDIS